MKLDPDTVELEEGFTRDTRGIGHYGTGGARSVNQDGRRLSEGKEAD